MTWSRETENALEAWLAPETAHKSHSLDDARFYDFISYVWIDVQSIWDEELAREKMNRKAKELHPNWQPDMIENFINDRLSEGSLILDFLSNAKEKGLPINL